jgi:hypothetical protein
MQNAKLKMVAHGSPAHAGRRQVFDFPFSIFH